MNKTLDTMKPAVEGFRILDTYAPGGVVEVAEPRMDALATISAGLRGAERQGKPGLPMAVKDGTIQLHDEEGRAPGLRAILEDNEFRRLTIAFPSDDPRVFIQQRFTEYSAASLLCHGDEKSLTVIQGDQQYQLLAGTPEYTQQLQRCKVSVSVYFHAAQWTADGPRVIFPDGVGLYRLRFTSRNSLRNIVASLQTTMRYTQGRIAGMPLELSLSYREVPAPDGKRRRVVVWQLLFRPPHANSLSSANFRETLRDSLDQGEALMLNPAEIEQMEMKALEAPATPDLDEAAVEEIMDGGLCDVAHHRKHYFAMVAGTPFEGDDPRANLVAEYSGGKTDSLTELLEHSTEDDAAAFIAFVADQIKDELMRRVRKYNQERMKAEAKYGLEFSAIAGSTNFQEVNSAMRNLRASVKVAPQIPKEEPRNAIHANVQKQVAAAEENRAEADEIFGGDDEPQEAEIVDEKPTVAAIPDEDEYGPDFVDAADLKPSEHVQMVLSALEDKQLRPLLDSMSNPTFLSTVVNPIRTKADKPHVDTLLDIDGDDAGKLLAKINGGKVAPKHFAAEKVAA